MTDIKKILIDGLIDSVLDKDKISDSIKDVILGDDDKDKKPKKRSTSRRSTSRRSTSMLELELYGPVDLPTTGSGSKREVTKEDVEAFWDDSDAREVAAKEGVFVFALKSGSRFTPWYVGKATKSLKTSTLATKAKSEINKVLPKEKGKPVIFFVAPGGNKRSFPSRELGDCDSFITQSCLAANSKLKGLGSSTPPMWSIDGVIRSSGRSTADEKDFAEMLGL